VVRALVDFVAPVLEEQGELEMVRVGVERILAEGTGSQLQRGPFRVGGLPAVVERAVELTTQGSAPGTTPKGRADEGSPLGRVRRG
jgi:carboxylate-amine ligase